MTKLNRTVSETCSNETNKNFSYSVTIISLVHCEGKQLKRHHGRVS